MEEQNNEENLNKLANGEKLEPQKESSKIDIKKKQKHRTPPSKRQPKDEKANLSFMDNLIMKLGGPKMATIVVLGVCVILVGLAGILLVLIQNGKRISDDEKKEILVNTLRNNPVDLFEDLDDSAFPDDGGVNGASLATDRLGEGDSAGGEDDGASSSNPITDPDSSTNIVNPDTADIPRKEVEEDYTQRKMILKPNLSTTEYRHSVSETSYGPKVGNCYYFRPTNRNKKVEYSDYYLRSGYYSKRLEQDADSGDLLDWSLNRNNPYLNESSYYEYKGADYAVKINYPTYDPYPDSYPASYPDSYVDSYPDSFPYPSSYDYKDVLDYYFGEGVHIELREKDSQSYYVIRGSYESSSCVSGGADFYSTVITLRWVNADDYKLELIETFLDDVSEANLFSRVKIDNQIKPISDEQVEEIFSFGSLKDDVALKEFNYKSDPSLYNEKNQINSVVNHLSEYDDLLFLSLDRPKDAEFGYINAPLGNNLQLAFRYIRDRNFYPDGDLGDELFHNEIYYYDRERFAEHIVTTTWHMPDRQGYLPFTIYSKDESDEKILNLFNPLLGFRKDNAVSEVANIKTSFNDGRAEQSINARIYEYSYKVSWLDSYPVSHPISYPTSYPDSYPYSLRGVECSADGCFMINHVILFEYGDYKYSIYVDSWTDFDIEKIDFFENPVDHTLSYEGFFVESPVDRADLKDELLD
jgi:hypothetical protein